MIQFYKDEILPINEISLLKFFFNYIVIVISTFSFLFCFILSAAAAAATVFRLIVSKS